MSVRIVKYGIAIMLLGFVALLSSCASSNVREAQKVVAQADSLWHEGKMYGVDMGDSATLAQAYETLKEYSAFSRQCAAVCPFVRSTSSLRTYSHACYHYGKLLRAKDDPVSAMQVFIDATHSQTDDYHILGRVYSNIGDICHLAGEFPLSYDMFEKSANMFLQNGDTLNYYYGLNEMAFESAEQGKKEETMHLLAKIEENYRNAKIVAQNLRAKAILYREIEQYDSVLCTIDSLHTLGIEDIIGYVLKAQSFWFIEKKDSALSYAKYVMTLPKASSQDRHNMIYILLNCDSTLTNEELIKLSAQRSDIETDVLIPLHNQLAVAVQLLKQDLTRKPDLRWLYAVLTTLIFVAAGISIYVFRKRQRQALLAQKLESLQQATSYIQKKNEKLTECYRQNQKQIVEDIDKKCAMLQDPDKIKKSLAWKDYNKMCNIVDKQFYLLASKLKTKYLLNETEVRLCVLVLLDMSRADIAHLLPYALSSVGKLKDQTAKKIGTTGKNMRNYLIDREIEG